MIAAYAVLIPGISGISAQNAMPVIHKTATDRIISPVGKMALTPNFAIGVVGSGGHVVVEAAGAAFRQTLTVMNARNLTIESQLGFLKKQPRGNKSIPGISKQSFFQGLAVGPDGMFYVAGGVSNNVIALRLERGKLKLIRKYPLIFQAFPKTQYPYQYQGVLGATAFFCSAATIADSSSGEIDGSTRAKTAAAFSACPCRRYHLGDSGKLRRSQMTNSAGTAPISNIVIHRLI